MLESNQKQLSAAFKQSSSKLALAAEGILVGILAGLGAVAYRYILTYAGTWQQALYQMTNFPWLIGLFLFLGIMGALTGILVQLAPLSSGSGIPQVSGELLGEMSMRPLPTLFSKYLGGFMAMLAGMSLGREGPSIQIGAAISKAYTKWRKHGDLSQRILLTSGASAGLSAAFNAPIASTLFVVEEVHKNISPFILIPALLASISADLVSKWVFGLTPSFAIKMDQLLPQTSYYLIIILGLVTALVGTTFNQVLLAFQRFLQKHFPNVVVRIALGFLLTGLIVWAFPALAGSGHDLVYQYLEMPWPLKSLILVLVGKLLFTCFCYGTSTPGGIFLPTLVMGCLTGAASFQVFSLFIDLDPDLLANFVVLGMAGVLTAVVRSPLTSMVLVLEMVGSLQNFLPVAIVAITAYLLAEALKVAPIYDSLYDRMRPLPQDHKEKEAAILEFDVPLTSSLAGKKLAELDLPQEILIASIVRGRASLVPKGATTIQAKDRLLIVTSKDHLAATKKLFREAAKT